MYLGRKKVVVVQKRVLLFYSILMDLLFENGFSGSHPEKLHANACKKKLLLEIIWL